MTADLDAALAAEEHTQGRPYTADPDHCDRCAEVDRAWAESVGEIDDPGPSGLLVVDESVSDADLERIKATWNARLAGMPLVLPKSASFVPAPPPIDNDWLELEQLYETDGAFGAWGWVGVSILIALWLAVFALLTIGRLV